MKTVKETADEIVAEVERAEKMWGTDFDSKNTLNDWAAYINIYLGKAAVMGASKDEVVKNLRKAAGLTLTVLRWTEADALAPRHYDGQSRPDSLPEVP